MGRHPPRVLLIDQAACCINEKGLEAATICYLQANRRCISFLCLSGGPTIREQSPRFWKGSEMCNDYTDAMRNCLL